MEVTLFLSLSAVSQQKEMLTVFIPGTIAFFHHSFLQAQTFLYQVK